MAPIYQNGEQVPKWAEKAQKLEKNAANAVENATWNKVIVLDPPNLMMIEDEEEEE